VRPPMAVTSVTAPRSPTLPHPSRHDLVPVPVPVPVAVLGAVQDLRPVRGLSRSTTSSG
jgi:hypothetical protein